MAEELNDKAGRITSSLVLFIFVIRSEIFDGVVPDQPGKPGKQCGDEPFYDCDHNELLIAFFIYQVLRYFVIAIKNYRNDSYMTEIWEKDTQIYVSNRL